MMQTVPQLLVQPRLRRKSPRSYARAACRWKWRVLRRAAPPFRNGPGPCLFTPERPSSQSAGPSQQKAPGGTARTTRRSSRITRQAVGHRICSLARLVFSNRRCCCCRCRRRRPSSLASLTKSRDEYATSRNPPPPQRSPHRQTKQAWPEDSRPTARRYLVDLDTNNTATESDPLALGALTRSHSAALVPASAASSLPGFARRLPSLRVNNSCLLVAILLPRIPAARPISPLFAIPHHTTSPTPPPTRPHLPPLEAASP